MDQLAPVLTALALIITALGGLSLRRTARERELSDRAKSAEGSDYRRGLLLRRLALWLVESRHYDELPDTLRSDLERETET